MRMQCTDPWLQLGVVLCTCRLSLSAVCISLSCWQRGRLLSGAIQMILYGLASVVMIPTGCALFPQTRCVSVSPNKVHVCVCTAWVGVQERVVLAAMCAHDCIIYIMCTRELSQFFVLGRGKGVWCDACVELAFECSESLVSPHICGML